MARKSKASSAEPTPASKRTKRTKGVAPKKRVTRLSAKPADELRIAVTFKRPTDGLGLVKYGARMTADVVKSFLLDELLVGKALDALMKEGFKVTQRGGVSLSVRAKRKDFERVFGTKLTAFKMRVDETTRPSAGAVYFPADGAPWNPDPTVAALIDDAYIQWPHIYMNNRFTADPSPLPPRIDYHHLRVPGDVALLLNAAQAHREGITGRGVRVAMIDSGFAHQHPFFEEMGYNSSVILAPGATQVERDGYGHGTGESANLFAIAPDITFIGVKLDNEENPYLGASLLEGFQEAIQHNPDVISISLGFDLCPTDIFGQRISDKHLTSLPNSLRPLEAEIEDAIANGVVVVISAGNGHVGFPGMMPDVLCAGGVFIDADGSMSASDYASAYVSKIYPGRVVPDFSGLVGMAHNHSQYIMLPVEVGCEIDKGGGSSDGTDSTDGWSVFSGTSAAAPQVAGICALLLQKDPHLTPADIKQILRRTCRDVVNGHANAASNEGYGGMPATSGTDGATGAGLVDAYAALRQVG